MDNKAESQLKNKLQIFNHNYERMEELYKKLIILNSHKFFLNQYKLKQIHKYYFSTMTNSSEQFYTFICLASWLIKEKCELQLKNDINPEEYEDPNITIYNILDCLRSIGKTVEFSPNKLKQGYGEELIFVLNCFADKALEKFEIPNQARIDIVNNNLDITQFDNKNEYLDDDEEEDAKYLFKNQQYTVIDDEDDDSLLESLSDSKTNEQNSPNKLSSNINKLKEENFSILDNKTLAKKSNLNKSLMKPNIDKKLWQAEFEQMLPQLKLANRMLEESGNNWRVRFNELKKRNALINNELNHCNDGLNKLELDIQKGLDRLESKERYVQQQMDSLCNELLAHRSELDRSTENYQQINGGVISKSKKLAELNEQIQKIKTEVEKREHSISDKTPLLEIRKALNKLRLEIDDLNIRIGVVLHNVMHQNLIEKIQKNEFNSTYSHDIFYNAHEILQANI